MVMIMVIVVLLWYFMVFLVSWHIENAFPDSLGIDTVVFELVTVLAEFGLVMILVESLEADRISDILNGAR
jgi:hypothetical protein